MKAFSRPDGLAQLAQWQDWDDFSNALKEFMLAFAHMDHASRQRAIEQEPQPTGDALKDAYLAAVADFLAVRVGLRHPDWCSDPRRALQRPWYAAKSQRMKNVLLRESPAAFRIRNLFVSANVLDRPGLVFALNECRWKPGSGRFAADRVAEAST